MDTEIIIGTLVFVVALAVVVYRLKRTSNASGSSSEQLERNRNNNTIEK